MDIVVILFGLIIGSFLNVLIYRLPLGISILNPKRSFCTSCEIQIKWYENIPILSYVFLKAKCASCGVKISYVYPIVELISTIVTYMLFLKLGINYEFYIILLLIYILIVLSFIDFTYKAVPDYLLVIVLVISFFINNFSFKDALLFAGGFVLLNFFITYYIQNIKSVITKNEYLREQTALGEGDIPIVTLIGGILGIQLGLVAIFLSSIFAIVPAIYNSVAKNDIETPFIPFLVLGLLCCYFFDKQILLILNGLI